MIDRQHVWVGPDATTFEASCEACLARREDWSVAVRASLIEGTLRYDADVGFMTCRRGHRIIVRRVGRRALADAFHRGPPGSPAVGAEPLARPGRATFPSSRPA